MLVHLFDAAWLFGSIASISLLVYAAWLVWQFQSNASVANKQSVARLALHESLTPNERVSEVKAAALSFKEAGSLQSAAPHRALKAIAPDASVRPNLEGSRRVLVVDDNLDAVQSTAALIRMMGHECEFAINGFAALAVARQFRPHIILLDIGLPDLNGHDIARQLKWEPGLESTRIIAITGLPDADRQRALEAGCEEFYRKPLDPMLLEQLLAKPRGFAQQKAA